MQRATMLVLVLAAMLMTPYAILHLTQHDTTSTVTYTTFIAERTSPNLAELVQSIPVKARLIVWKNGVVVYNGTDPLTRNFYIMFAAYIIGGLKIDPVYTTVVNEAGSEINLCNYRVTGETNGLKIELGNGTYTADPLAHNLSSPVTTMDKYYVTQNDTSVIIVASKIWDLEPTTITEIGLFIGYSSNPGTLNGYLLASYDEVNIPVDHGDNITVAYIFYLPTSGAATKFMMMIGYKSTYGHFCSGQKIVLTINQSGTLYTSASSQCMNIIYNVTDQYYISGVCIGVVDYNGNVTRIELQSYDSFLARWYTVISIDINVTDVNAGMPYAFTYRIEFR